MSWMYEGTARMQGLAFSPVRKVLDRATQLAAEGRSIIHFEIGEPDFAPPQEILDAVHAAMEAHKTHYGPNRGVLSLRQEIARKLREQNRLEYSSEEEILVTVGAAEALFDIILANIGEGDEVIVFTPAFMNYANVVTLAGGKMVPVALRMENGFQIDPDAVRKAMTDRTRMLIVTNPHNPTGTLYSAGVLEELAKIAVEHDLIVLSDEIYEDIVYDDAQPVSIATYPGMRARTYVVNGFSKNYAMTGFRLGYLAADKRLIPHVLKLHQYVTTCAPTFLQEGIAKTMLAPACVARKQEMVDTFARRRKILLEGIASIDGVETSSPQGAFYAFVKVSGTGLDGAQFAERLLEECGVALVPGAGFGERGEDFVRISYATAEEDIKEGLGRIKRFVEGIRS